MTPMKLPLLKDIPEKDSGVSSYEDIVTMIRVLEKEDLESRKFTFMF